jgi:hypothetical protein
MVLVLAQQYLFQQFFCFRLNKLQNVWRPLSQLGNNKIEELSQTGQYIYESMQCTKSSPASPCQGREQKKAAQSAAKITETKAPDQNLRMEFTHTTFYAFLRA